MAGIAGITAASGRFLQGQARTGEASNILFLMTDQHRGTAGLCRKRCDRTPNLDRRRGRACSIRMRSVRHPPARPREAAC